ncbi:hypothetical protein EC991_006321 [Linnemannia zychae]|nr:hypothetical protein EC991_006321 [Linnemannia zychae]
MRNVSFPAVAPTAATEALAAHQRRESSGDWTIDRYHQQQQRQQQLDSAELHPRPPAPEPSDKKPLSALERIKRQQKRQSQEQERLADLVLPPELLSKPSPSKTGLGGLGVDHVLPIREVPLDRVPIQAFHPLATASQISPLPLVQQQQSQSSGGSRGGIGGLASTDPGAAIIGTDSAMLDQLLTLIPGPNRPRLPTQTEWQQGIEELRQRRKDAAALTNSVGRQNSSGSRHSQDSSADGKSRRHSMPDMPHGQSREDQEKQRGDHFRNPMLMSNNSAYSSSTSAVLNSSAAQKRRSGFEDREQQLLQPPIQRQSIAETQVMDVSMIPSPSVVPMDPKKAGRKRAGKNGVTFDNVSEQRVHVAASETTFDRVDKDVVDIAFNEMLTTLSLTPATIAQLESLPKERKWAMLQSKDANPTLLQTPQTMPPQFFVDLLLEYAGKKKRSSRDQFAFNVAAMTANSAAVTPARSMGMWKNFSATNLTGNGSSSTNINTDSFASGIVPTLQPTFQQHLSSLLGKNDKRALEEREQVLKKLRVLIRNGSIRWTGEFIKVGGPLALLQFCQHIQRTEETKLGQRERLLHQVIQCIKAIVPLDGGIESLTSESIFFSLMRTMAIHEAPVLSRMAKSQAQGSKAKTGGFFGIGEGGASVAVAGAGGQRYRSSSIPKPLPQTRLGNQSGVQSLLALSADQIPPFSNTQSAIHVLISILAREPELRERVLKETVADRNPVQGQRKSDEGSIRTYSEWIDYLKEIMHVCGIEAPLPSLTTPVSPQHPSRGNDGFSQERGRKNSSPPKVVSMGGGIVAQGCGPSGPSLSIFSLENMRNKRRHSAAATPQASQSTLNVTTSGIKFEAGEDRDVLAYLTAHLELVSRLVFEMHVSPQGLAFAKSIKQEQLEDYLERLRSTFIRSHDLSAQVEDLLIQLSAVPSTTQMMATLLTKDLPTIPPIDTMSQINRAQQERRQQQRSPSERPTSPTFQRLGSPLMQQVNQRSHNASEHDARRDSQVIDAKDSNIDIPARTSSLDSLSGTAGTHVSSKYGNGSNYGNSAGNAETQRLVNDATVREESRVQQRVSQFHQQQQQQQQQQHANRQQFQPQIDGSDKRSRSGVAPAMQGGEMSPIHAGSPPSRQTSYKKDVSEGGRQTRTNNNNNNNNNNNKSPSRNQSPLPSPLQQQFPQQNHYQQQQPLGRVSGQITFRENISFAPAVTSSASRRVSMGSTSPTPPLSPLSPTSPSSRLPMVPAKSKHRPHSVDGKGSGFGYGAGDSHVEKVIIRLDNPRSQPQQFNSSQRPPQSPSVTSFPLSRGTPEPRQQDSSSNSTFGYGRRSSLNNSNGQLLGVPKTTRGPALQNDSSSRDRGDLKPVAHGVNSLSADGSAMSTCSSTTSSGFSATSSSSASSVSPSSTQTKKLLIMTTTTGTNNSSSIPLPLLSPSKLPRKVISPMAAASPLDAAPTARSTTPTAAKKVHQFRNVDFDNRIQEDVRRLASSSSSTSLRNNSSNNSSGNSSNSHGRGTSDASVAGATGGGYRRYEIQATDPKVLEAPIIVPEDMSLIREQYIQAQVNGLVLPPMERKA